MEVGKGYSPKSAVERQISNGKKYDNYFPKPKNKVVLLKKDGSVEDTIKYMKQIVNDYSYQTKDIAKVLAVHRSDNSLDIYETVHNVYDFVCKYLKYNIEQGEQLRQPAFTWHQAQVLARQHPENPEYSCDCDCMAIFCASIFHNLRIPNVKFKITGYSLMGGFQHVYCVVKTDRGEIICDPVYWQFDAEKTPIKQKEFNMDNRLYGTDIYMLAGIEDGSASYPMGDKYVEQSDGSLGLLSGKAKRKAKKAEKQAKKQARKVAKKEKKQAKAEIKQAKKSGDKAALEAAKAKKRKAKETINENRTGVGKAVKKVGNAVKKASLAPARGPFLLLIRLNFRGLAKRLGNNPQAMEKVKNLWKNLGGKPAKLEKAVSKGKGKKALFGSKKKLGDLRGQIDEIGQVMYDYGMISSNGLKGIGIVGLGVEPTTMTVGAAITAATPIIAKVINVLKDMGITTPESGEELENGESYDTSDDDSMVDTNEDFDDSADYSYEAPQVFEDDYSSDFYNDYDDDYEEDYYDDFDEDEYEEDFDGVNGYFEIGEIVNPDGTLGKGIFAKKGKKSKLKAKKSKGKESKKTSQKAKARKEQRKAKKVAKKKGAKAKKEQRSAKKTEKSKSKAAQKTEKKQRKEQRKEKRKAAIQNTIKKDSQIVQNVRDSGIVESEKYMDTVKTINNGIMDNTKGNFKTTSTPEDSWVSRNKWLLIGGGALTALVVTLAVMNNKSTKVNGLGLIKDMKLR